MGLLDTIIGDLAGTAGGQASALPTAVNALLGGAQENGLGGLVQRFESAGLGHIVHSWIGSGPNQSISPQDLHRALGDDKVQQAAAQSGLSVAQLLPLLAQQLPNIIDRLTPNGTVPKGDMQKISV